MITLSSLARGNFVTLSTRYSADPSPLVVGDRLYIYATHDERGARSFSMLDYNVFSTLDGVNWRDDGIAFSPVHNTTWAHNAWAQQTFFSLDTGLYTMYFPGMGNPSVGVATSLDPRGLFVDYALRGIAPGDDPTIFIDDDGTRVLCTSVDAPYNSPSCGELAADMKSWSVNQSQVFIEGLAAGDYFEAPWLMKIGVTYYLSFMQNFVFGGAHGAPFGWSLGWASRTAAPARGNYSYRGTLMWANPLNCDDAAHCGDASGTPGGNTHHGFALDWPRGSGKHWLAYHTRNLAVAKGEVTFSQRNVGFDRLYISPNGALLPVTSTRNWTRQLAYVDPYVTQPAAMMAPGSALFLGTQPAGAVDAPGGQWRYLWNITDGSAIRVAGVDFGARGPASVTVRAATPLDGVTAEARLGTADGPLIAAVALTNTGAWEAFANSTVAIAAAAATGAHDLWFVFRLPAAANDAMICNVASWAFAGGAASGAVPPPVTPRVVLHSRASGEFVGLSGANSALIANATTAGRAVFILSDNEDGSWALRAEGTGRLVVASADAERSLSATGAAPAGGASSFRLQGTPDGAYALSLASVDAVVVVRAADAALAATGNATTLDWQAENPLFDLIEV